MTTRPFRFGVVAGFASSADAWTGIARRAEHLGYSTLLVPDTLNTFSPFVAAAVAASATTTLRVGTYVISSPYRTPAAVAWEAKTLHTLTGGRFELGLGAGRPNSEQDTEKLGLAFGSPAERIERIAQTVDLVQDMPILIAAAGTKLLRLAAQKADIVALGVPVTTTEEQLAAKLDELYELAGDRFEQLEVTVNLAAVGDELPGWLARQIGSDPHEVVANGGTGILTGTVDEMVETLQRRRDKLGISYVSVNGQFMEQFAPVVERLAGT